MKSKIIFNFILLLFIFSCKKDDPSNNGIQSDIEFNSNITYGTITDQDGNTYKTVKIGTQTWMAENLKTTKYNDGTPISNITDGTNWVKSTTGAYCWYNNDASTNKNTYGALYNWYAVKTNKLAPIGWHIPSNMELNTLINFLGGKEIAGSKLRETGSKHWVGSKIISINSDGFTALPAGLRTSEGNFETLGYKTYWWNSSEENTNEAYFWGTEYDTNSVDYDYYFKMTGHSVRCIKD